jgi:diguanylate cyclase (GGDEF)-like protein
MIAMPLHDISGRAVAHMVLVADVSDQLRLVQSTFYKGTITAGSVGVFLLALFYWLVGRVGLQIDRSEQELERLATHDGLTGLFNRRSFNALLDDEVSRTQRYGLAVSLLMVDIDHFKRINDSYGHQVGDAVLQQMGGLLANSARGVDKVCRYGGEEIALILPQTGAEEAANIGERLRARIAENAFDLGQDRPIPVTVSIGVAACPANATDSPTLVRAADEALYEAKQGGRNRVCGSQKTAG